MAEEPDLIDDKRVAQMILTTAEELADKLAGLGPQAQSAILADLVALYLAGWASHERDEVWIAFTKLTWQLIEPNEKLIFGKAGHPGGKTF